MCPSPWRRYLYVVEIKNFGISIMRSSSRKEGEYFLLHFITFIILCDIIIIGGTSWGTWETRQGITCTWPRDWHSWGPRFIFSDHTHIGCGYVKIGVVEGLPVSLNEKELSPASLFAGLNEIGETRNRACGHDRELAWKIEGCTRLSTGPFSSRQHVSSSR